MNRYTFVGVGVLLGIGFFAAPVRAQDNLSAAVAADTNASAVSVTSLSVGMTYPVKARLFGVLPVGLPARIEIQSDGSVAVEYPWYIFLFSTDQAELQMKLQAVGQAASAWNTDTLTAQQQTTLLSLTHAALESDLDAAQSSGDVQ